MDFVKIKIGSEFASGGFDAARSAFGALDSQAKEFFNTLKMGVGIDLGGRLVDSIASIPAAFEAAIRRGVEFNVKMHDAELAIGQVLQKFQGLDAIAAKNEAARAMAQIAELEPRTAATMDGLVQGFMATLAASQSAGMSVSQNIELVGSLANALSNANIPAEQLSQEMRSIVSGNITADSALAQVLSITNADVAAAREAGNLFDMLTKKVGTLGEAGDSFAVRWSSLESAIDKSLATITKPVFDVLFQSLQALSEELQNPEVVQSLQKLGFQVAHVVEAGGKLLSWALANAPALAALASGVITLGAALAGLTIARFVVSLGAWTAGIVAGSVATARAAVATQAETAALAANTAAQTANAAARGANAGAAGAGAAGRAAGGLGAGGALGIASAGVAIGGAIYAYRVAKAHEDLAAAQTNDALVDTLEEQRLQLVAQVKAATDLESKAAARKALEDQIAVVRRQSGQRDEDGQVIAAQGIRNLQRTLMQFDKLAGSQPAVAPTASADDRRLRTLAETDARTEEGRKIREIGMNPEELLAQRQGRAGELRENVAHLLTAGGAPTNPDFSADAALSGVEKTSYDAEGKKALLDAIKELAEVEKQVTAEQEKQGEALDENKAKEADIFAKAKEAADVRRETLADLASEHEVLTAQLAGRDAEAKALERKRALQKEILSLEASGLEHAEAKAAAEKNAALRLETERQAKAKEREQRQAEIEADMAVDLAGAKRSKRGLREAQENALRVKKKKEFGEAGYEGAELDQMVDSAVDIHRRQNRRPGQVLSGGFGDEPGGGLQSGGLESSGLKSGKGLTPTADWDQLFGSRTRLGDLVPQPASNEAPSAPKGGADPLSKAATAAEGADKSVKTNAEKMSKALDGVKSSADTAFSSIASKLDQLSKDFKELKSKVEAQRTE